MVYAHNFLAGENIDERKRCELFRFLVENADSYMVDFPEEKYKDDDAFYNGYDLLKDEMAVFVSKDDTGFATWQKWKGEFDEDKKVKLIVYLGAYPIYNLTFLKDGEELYQINDFRNLYSLSKGAFEALKEKFPEFDYFIYE